MARKKSRQKTSVHKSSGKRTARHSKRVPEHADLGVPKPEVDRFMGLYKAKRLVDAEQVAQSMTERYPESAFAWKALGTTLLEDGRVDEALEHLHRSVDIKDSDPLSLTSLAAVYYRQGENDQAVRYQARAVELQPDYAPAQYRLAEMLQSAGKQIEALKHANKAQELGYDAFRSGILVGSLLYQTKYFSQALDIYQQLERDYPGQAPVYNNLGNLYKDIGQYELSESYYQQALEAQSDYVMAYSNIFFAKHYNPDVSQQAIVDFAKGWDSRFALPPLPAPANPKDPAKPLRVGLISSGFRIHPVGQMIATAMEHSRQDIHFYAYTTNDHDDYVTRKIREATRVWRPVRHLGQEALARQIRDDAIDILIDLSGHGDGSCLQAISMRPAPLCIKWVGGLVNTMGLSSIDYLLSDAIETLEGVDDQYTEKLIRLPDDYICYMPCPYAPATASLPAIKNGYVTLGCLNNPAKIGETLLGEWARLMHELPESRLLLRGAQYESEDFCGWIRQTLAEHGIAEYRVLLEGPTKHAEFLETYQRIDIALDSWPYSGGLTTCEAMLMGVPVVTLPGPTFAGRHSATHLINAGLQELVTSSWDEYRQRVLELANDLPNLAVIRAGLRTVLHYSPVCDAPRFAHHFNNALRAIWQRHCDDKAPEALTFNKEGDAWFADEGERVDLVEAREEEEPEPTGFEWQLDEPVTVIDNAAVLPRHPDYAKWMASGHLAVISFDPASLLNNKIEALQEYGELHHYPHALLGDGQPATLYATLDAEKGSTLKPLPAEQLPEDQHDKLKVLTELSINTVALDQVEGLPSVDMLVLDDLHEAMQILENGERTLKDTLLIQVKVAFQPTHERQPNFAELQHWASRHGFRFYRFESMRHCSHLPEVVPETQRQATELLTADVLFMPSHERIKMLDDSQRTKLAFLLHTIYGIQDMAYALLCEVSQKKSETFLAREGLLEFSGCGRSLRNQSSAEADLKRRKVFVVGFPKSGTSTIQKALEETGYSSAHWRVREGFVGELMYKGLSEKNDPWYFLSDYDAIAQSDVCMPIKGYSYWPNLDLDVIGRLRDKHPGCLFVLNYRNPKETAYSIARWGDFLDRLKSSSVPGLRFQGVDDVSDLEAWVARHHDKVRDFFEGDDNFLEVDIADESAPQLIGEALGLELAWWGVVNNNASNKKNALPDQPHMSDSERQLFSGCLSQAENYFEFGAGGSTVWAVKEGLDVKGVESDINWVNALKKELGPPCRVKAVGIGPTTEWGFPADAKESHTFPEYSRAIFQHSQPFDLVLVDGRFRVACTMTAIEHIARNPCNGRDAYIFIHDFWNRPHYHVVLQFLDVVESVESAGVFQVQKDVDLNAVRETWKQYACQPA